MEWYITVDGKRMRRGLTTGTCATAAAVAAVKGLSGERVDAVQVTLPKGEKVALPIYWTEKSAYCIKDGGDDPDVTTGAQIHCHAQWQKEGVLIAGGEGIGVITRDGLGVGIGEAAINEVPRQMIRNHVEKLLPPGKGVKLTFAVPGGEKLAEKTLNGALGIQGGISILGTTGIVEPMSEEAYKHSLALELKMKQMDSVVLVPGNFGKEFAASRGVKEEKIVRISNFVGFMLDQCQELHVKELLLIGQIGKVIKVAAGIMNTHSHIADARAEILTAYCGLCGADAGVLGQVYSCKTVEEAIPLLQENRLEQVYDLICTNALGRIRRRFHGQVEIMVYSLSHGLLVQSAGAEKMLERMK